MGGCSFILTNVSSEISSGKRRSKGRGSRFRAQCSRISSLCVCGARAGTEKPAAGHLMLAADFEGRPCSAQVTARACGQRLLCLWTRPVDCAGKEAGGLLAGLTGHREEGSAYTSSQPGPGERPRVDQAAREARWFREEPPEVAAAHALAAAPDLPAAARRASGLQGRGCSRPRVERSG